MVRLIAGYAIVWLNLIGLLFLMGCGGGGSTPEVFNPPVGSVPVTQDQSLFSQTTPSSGKVVFSNSDANLEINAYVTEWRGNPVEGINVQMLQGLTRIVIIANDPQGRYIPRFKEIQGPTSVHIGSTVKGLYNVQLVLGSASKKQTCVNHDFYARYQNQDTSIPGLNQTDTDVSNVADSIAQQGGIVRINYDVPGGFHNSINYNFSKNCTKADIHNRLSEFLDPNASYQIRKHNGLPQYVEIDAGLIGDIYQVAEEIEMTYIVKKTETLTAEVTVTNNSSSDHRLIITPGTTFIHSNQKKQNLTVVNSTILCVKPGETKTADVYCACVNADREAGGQGALLTPSPDQRQDLVQWCSFTDYFAEEIDKAVVYRGIHVITNNVPPEQFRYEICSLFNAAGLKVSMYPSLY